MTEGQRRFAVAAVRRKRLFLALSIVGVVAGVALLLWTVWLRWHDASAPVGLRAALAVFVLLNARRLLREYRYAGVLEELLEDQAGALPRAEEDQSFPPSAGGGT